MKDSFAGYSNLGLWLPSPFRACSTSFYALFAFKVSVEKYNSDGFVFIGDRVLVFCNFQHPFLFCMPSILTIK
jgi:hypothetical protein